MCKLSPWSKSSFYTFYVDDGGCFGCCCSSCAFFFSFTIFWAVDLQTAVSAAVLSHTRCSDSFLPDFFSSMQNLSTFSIIAVSISIQASPFCWVKSLYMCIIHQNILFLQLCKSRKISCIFEEAKKKVLLKWLALENFRVQKWGQFRNGKILQTCKSRKIACIFEEAKKRFYWGSNLQPCYQVLWVQPLYLLRHRIDCKSIL